MHHRPRGTSLALAGALAVSLGACADRTATAPQGPAAPRGTINTVALQSDRVAVIEADRSGPVLHIQDELGKSRIRVHFENVRDRIAGNLPEAYMPPPTDATIRGLGPARWSPDGQQLAIVVTNGADVSQVVVMNADGRNMRTASPNMTVVIGDIDWAPDSRAIAYTLMTNMLTKRADLFMTDLVKDEVRRLTTKGLASVWDEYRWSPDGSRLWYTELDRFDEGSGERVSRIQSVDRDGVITGTLDEVTGDVQGIARDRSWALALRWTKDGGRELVRVPIGKGGEEQLLAAGDLRYAELLEDDREAMLVAWPSREGASYRLLGTIAGDVRANLPIGDAAISAAILRARR